MAVGMGSVPLGGDCAGMSRDGIALAGGAVFRGEGDFAPEPASERSDVAGGCAGGGGGDVDVVAGGVAGLELGAVGGRRGAGKRGGGDGGGGPCGDGGLDGASLLAGLAGFLERPDDSVRSAVLAVPAVPVVLRAGRGADPGAVRGGAGGGGLERGVFAVVFGGGNAGSGGAAQCRAGGLFRVRGGRILDHGPAGLGVGRRGTAEMAENGGIGVCFGASVGGRAGAGAHAPDSGVAEGALVAAAGGRHPGPGTRPEGGGGGGSDGRLVPAVDCGEREGALSVQSVAGLGQVVFGVVGPLVASLESGKGTVGERGLPDGFAGVAGR